MRNLEAKIPADRWLEIKAELVAIRDAATLEAGGQAAAAFLARHADEFPSACACLSDDLAALLDHLRLPWRLRKFVRTTNFCERSFVEEWRRSKTLPRFFTEKSFLKLVFATLIRAAERWPRIAIQRWSTRNCRSCIESAVSRRRRRWARSPRIERVLRPDHFYRRIRT